MPRKQSQTSCRCLPNEAMGVPLHCKSLNSSPELFQRRCTGVMHPSLHPAPAPLQSQSPQNHKLVEKILPQLKEAYTDSVPQGGNCNHFTQGHTFVGWLKRTITGKTLGCKSNLAYLWSIKIRTVKDLSPRARMTSLVRLNILSTLSQMSKQNWGLAQPAHYFQNCSDTCW